MSALQGRRFPLFCRRHWRRTCTYNTSTTNSYSQLTCFTNLQINISYQNSPAAQAKKRKLHLKYQRTYCSSLPVTSSSPVRSTSIDKKVKNSRELTDSTSSSSSCDLSFDAIEGKEEATTGGGEEDFVLPNCEPSILSSTTFTSLNLSTSLMYCLNSIKLIHLTKIQELSFSPLLHGQDGVVVAKNGHGKTLAYLLPILEVLFRYPPTQDNHISAVILVPTPELVDQMATEVGRIIRYSNVRLSFLNANLPVARERVLLRRARRNPGRLVYRIDIVITTAGRLLQHCEDERSGLKQRFEGLRTLVVDEFDLFMRGKFQDQLVRLCECLPNVDQRQTILCSATFAPADITQALNLNFVRSDYVMLDTVKDFIKANRNIQQLIYLSPLRDHIKVLYQVLKQEIASSDVQKIMVFIPGPAIAEFYYQLLSNTDLISSSSSCARLLCLHETMESDTRKLSARQFRVEAKHLDTDLILLTTAVSARGVDYPDVSCVVLTSGCDSRESYIHTIGRTARGVGKVGKAVSLLSGEVELEIAKALEREFQVKPIRWESEGNGNNIETMLEKSLQSVDSEIAVEAWKCWLFHFVDHPLLPQFHFPLLLQPQFQSESQSVATTTTSNLISFARIYANSLGILPSSSSSNELELLPPIDTKLAKKFGLLGVDGITTVDEDVGDQ